MTSKANIVTEAPFYNPQHYVFDGEDYWVSEHGLLISFENGTSAIINVTNGTLTINPLDDVPLAINFDNYIEDVLQAQQKPIGVTLVDWNPTVQRYIAPPIAD